MPQQFPFSEFKEEIQPTVLEAAIRRGLKQVANPTAGATATAKARIRRAVSNSRGN